MFLKEIIGNKIILRPYKESDILAWQKWDIDPEVQKHMPGPLNTPISDEKQIEYLKECENDPHGVYWSIVTKDNILVGSVAITDIENKVGELGIIIGEREFWGKGTASEAIELATTDIFENLKLEKVFAEYEEGNVGVEKALEKNGFKKEIFLKESRVKDGKKINTIKYNLENTLK